MACAGATFTLIQVHPGELSKKCNIGESALYTFILLMHPSAVSLYQSV